MNLCMPDTRKSCAACCGLYNVMDGTRPVLQGSLVRRTEAFRSLERTVAALDAYALRTRAEEDTTPLDPDIHVCEFAGFVDPELRLVGCMLHPWSPGNSGTDWRGLCHYGSMACKSFYCPSWGELPEGHRDVLVHLLDDWHLYGLVITDADFVRALFALVEELTGGPVHGLQSLNETARALILEICSWKDGALAGHSSRIRRSRYYMKGSRMPVDVQTGRITKELSEILHFTFGTDEACGDCAHWINGMLSRRGAGFDSGKDREDVVPGASPEGADHE